jgi:hypothetical protein
MINNAKILEMLREATLSEEKPVGLVQTDKIKGQSKDSNKDYYKDVEKKMSAYEKASTTSAKDSIEEPKFNYEGDSEKEYHDDMEIRNGMEMLNYDRKPSEKFTQRAKEAIEGSSNMGNNPEWANVFPAQKGFTGPDFGKNLVKTIERSKKKRDAATPTFDQFGDDIEEKNVGVNKTKSAYKPAVTKKPVAIGESVIKEADKKTFTIKYWLYMKDDNKEEFEKEVEAETAEEAMENFKKSDLGIKARKPRIVENVPPRPIVRQQDNPTEPRQTMKRPIVRQQDNPTEPQKTMKRPIVRQQDNPISESEVDPRNTHFLVEKSTGKILFAYDFTDEGPEYAKDALKDTAKDDIRDMDRNPRDIKVMTKQGLIKQGIDPMNMKNWVQSTSVDMEGKQINELSPSTYDSVAQAGRKRGDSRGQNIANTAEKLKYREVNSLPFTIKTKDGSIKKREKMKLEISGNPDIILTIGQLESPSFGVEIRGNKVVDAYLYNDYNNKIEFTKKTAINLAKAVKLITGYDINPNIFPQFVEEKQTTTESLDMNENYNKTTNESKMKRIKFKKPFNGVETALNVIPESYKVDNKVFEMTDGTEHYRVRWEGNLTEGKGVVLSSFHQEALNEDVSKIMHLMGFKSQDTLGNLKGSQRLTEDSVFFDMLKKSKESLNEAEAKPDFLDVDKDGDKKEPMKKAAKDAKSTKKKGIQEYAPDYDDPFGGEPDMEPLYFDVEVDYDPKKIGEYKERGWLQDLIVINFGGKHWSKSLELGSIVDYVKDPEIKKLADTVTERLLSLKKPFKAKERDLTRLFKDAKNISDMIYDILGNAINDLDVDWEEEDEFDWHTYQKDKQLESKLYRTNTN